MMGCGWRWDRETRKKTASTRAAATMALRELSIVEENGARRMRQVAPAYRACLKEPVRPCVKLA